MRPRMIMIAVAVVGAGMVGVVAATSGDGDESSPARPSALAAKTVTAGEITVRLEPHHLDASGAEFAVTLDTHSEELDMDLVAGATLVVNSTEWPTTAWDGDGPSGHHREGRLRFDATGPPAGPVELTLDGFPDPVAAQWTLDPVTP
jgi:hypothetical protein